MDVSPSKVKLTVNEIPEEDGNSGKKVKKTKKDEKKLNEFMKIYGLWLILWSFILFGFLQALMKICEKKNKTLFIN